MTVKEREIKRRLVGEADSQLVESIFESSRELERDVGQWTTAQWQQFILVQCSAQRTYYERLFPNAVHEIILVDEEPAGRTWIDRQQDEIRLLDITLLPEFRSQGIGTRLLRCLQDEARDANLPLRHMVERDNPRAMQLYERLGFRRISEHGMHFLMEWNPGVQT